MKKVVINKCYGGFGVSRDALVLLLLNGFPLESYEPDPEFDHLEHYVLEGPSGIRASPSAFANGVLRDGKLYGWPSGNRENEIALRSHPTFVKVVELLGSVASGECAKLVVEEVHGDAAYRITEREGYEWLEVSDPGYVQGFAYSETPLEFVPENGASVLPKLESPAD